MLHPNRRLAMAALPVIALAACAKPTAVVPDEMSLGAPTANVTVVEYASVACPVCGKWYKEVWPAFKTKYIDNSRIHFISREMLVGDTSEVAAAAAGFLLARCAGKDKYFAVTGAVYNSQPGLFDDPRGTLLRIAQSMGLDESRFNACINDQAALTALNKRVEGYVKNDHIDGTPTFVVGGKPLTTGYHSLADLDAAIAAAQAAK
jgi:protein-disulfide isomerase